MMPNVIDSFLNKENNVIIKMKVKILKELVELYGMKKDWFCFSRRILLISWVWLFILLSRVIYLCWFPSNQFKIDAVDDMSVLFNYNLIIRRRGSGSREIIEQYLSIRI